MKTVPVPKVVSPSSPKQGAISSGSGVSKRTDKLCLLCSETHSSVNCKAYPDLLTRMTRFKKLEKCLTCLTASHKTTKCTSKLTSC